MDWSEEEKNTVVEEIKNLLWTFVNPDASVTELQNLAVNLTKLNPKDLDYLAKIHFLLELELSGFTDIVNKILHRISHSTEQKVLYSRGEIRGRIDWNLTIKQRLVEGNNPILYVCRPTHKVYDLPENQLLKFMVVKIKRMLDDSGLNKIDSQKFDSDEFTKWTEQIGNLKYKINQIYRHVYLRTINFPEKVSSKMLTKCARSRNVLYRKILEAFYLFDDLVSKHNITKIKEFVEKRVLEPNDHNRLYEIFVLFRLLNQLRTDPLFTLNEIRLVYHDSKYVAEFEINNELVRVYDQFSQLFKDNKYKEILTYYEIGSSSRRPDIILEFVKSKKFLILEIKRTEDKDYITDSLYKVFGYVNDFEDYLQNKPKAVLIVWGNVPEKPIKKEHDVAIIQCGLDRKNSLIPIKELIIETCKK